MGAPLITTFYYGLHPILMSVANEAAVSSLLNLTKGIAGSKSNF